MGQPMPCEENWVGGMSHPSNHDVQPLGRLPVDFSSEGADSDSKYASSKGFPVTPMTIEYIRLSFASDPQAV